jgi:hypothetical protein
MHFTRASMLNHGRPQIFKVQNHQIKMSATKYMIPSFELTHLICAAAKPRRYRNFPHPALTFVRARHVYGTAVLGHLWHRHECDPVHIGASIADGTLFTVGHDIHSINFSSAHLAPLQRSSSVPHRSQRSLSPTSHHTQRCSFITSLSSDVSLGL